MTKKYTSFKEFYPYYLEEHQDSTCKKLHFIGSTLVIIVIVYSLWSTNYKWLITLPIIGYGFAWVGHFFFEKNKPATFKSPFYSFISDWVMWWQLLTGKLKF